MAAPNRNGLTVLSFTRHIRLFLLLLFTYLIQVCVMPYFSFRGITPSLIIVTIAVVTVAFGRLRAFWAGAFFGIVLECMLPTKAMLNLMLYPVSALLCSLVFADKSVQQLDFERSVGRAGRNITPYIRTPLCAFANVVIYDVVNIVYCYLAGNDILRSHIMRGLYDIVSTTVLCIVLMIPMRLLLGIRYAHYEQAAPSPYMHEQRT